MNKKKIFVCVSLIIILAITAFFRLWQLNNIPPALYPDVAVNGNNSLDSIKNNDFKVFYTDNNGREGLFMWLIALSFMLFGASVWAMKVVAATFGIFTVLGVYLLAKQIFKKINKNYEIIALASSFFLAISFWHVNFSRLGFRAIMVPFFLVFGFYFLLRALEDKKIYNAIISGIFFGLGFYSYISYRFVVILGLLLLGLWYFFFKKQRKQTLKITLYCLVFMVLVALPLGIYFLGNPQDFFGRAAGVSVLGDKNPLFSLGRSVLYSLGMFNVYGDSNWRHNYSGAPELIWPVGILFLLGFIILIRNIVVYARQKNKDENFIYPILLIAWFLILLLPCFLSSEGIPHALRAIGVIPAVYIISGLGALAIFEFLKKYFASEKKYKVAFYVLISLFLFILISSEFCLYFYQWGKNKEVFGAFTKDLYDVGTYLNSLPDGTQMFVVVNQGGVLVDGVPMPAQTPMFVERAKYGRLRAEYILPGDMAKIADEIDPSKNTEILFMGYSDELAMKTIALFPTGFFKDLGSFWVYNINKIVQISAEQPTSGSCGCNRE